MQESKTISILDELYEYIKDSTGGWKNIQALQYTNTSISKLQKLLPDTYTSEKITEIQEYCNCFYSSTRYKKQGNGTIENARYMLLSAISKTKSAFNSSEGRSKLFTE